jgi:2-hydroxychromene-2-carboxylate isomerase
MPEARLDFWFELASTYSYPAAMHISDRARERGVSVRWRPFLLGPIFKAQGWTSSPFNIYPAKGAYMWRDMERICAPQRLPFLRPKVFPQNSLMAARVALVALTQGWGEEFCRSVYRAEFGERRDIGAPGAVEEILREQGRDADAVLAQAESDAVKAALRAQCDEAQRLGIFGAPTFVTADGEMFWGNDRLEAALDWARR